MPVKLGPCVLRLERGEDAPAVGRRFVVHELETSGLADLADAAELAVSELVTNVLLHTDSVPTVSVETSAGSARVSVHDESPLTPLRGGCVRLIWPQCDGLIWPHHRLGNVAGGAVTA